MVVAAPAGARMMATSGFASSNIVRTGDVALNAAVPVGEFSEGEMIEGDCLFFDEAEMIDIGFGYEETIADTIGISVDQLFEGWEAGKSTADIARDNGVGWGCLW